MYCIKCGIKLPESSRFCMGCGAEVVETFVDKVVDEGNEEKLKSSVPHALGSDIDNLSRKIKPRASMKIVLRTRKQKLGISSTSVPDFDNPQAGKMGVSTQEKRNAQDAVNSFPREESGDKVPFITYTLIGLCIVSALIVYWKTGSFDPDIEEFIDLGASCVLVEVGERWRLLSSTFLHAGLKHLLCNIVCLFSFGILIERLLGHMKMLEVFLVSAILSELVSLTYHDLEASVGASGAVFGLFGTIISYIVLCGKKCGYDPKEIFSCMKSGLIFGILNFIYGLLPGVNMAAHIGGLISGLLLGGLLALPVLNPKIGVLKSVLHIVFGAVMIYVILPLIDLYTRFMMGVGHLQETEAFL